jgi:aryl-alcohol dehydrogenase-like predicted oxidoreductase
MRTTRRLLSVWAPLPKKRATRAQVALAWLLSKPGIAAPIIGASREEQLEELLQAVDLTLKPEQIAEMETPYKQHPVVGFK